MIKFNWHEQKKKDTYNSMIKIKKNLDEDYKDQPHKKKREKRKKKRKIYRGSKLVLVNT